MTKRTIVDRALRKRLERERDLLTELAHQIVANVEEGIDKRIDEARTTVEPETARALRKSETAKAFLIFALGANGIDQGWVEFNLEQRDGHEKASVSVNLRGLQNLDF